MANTEEIARLRVSITGATDAQIQRLEKLDTILASLRRTGTVNIQINGAGSLADALRAAENSAQNVGQQIRNSSQGLSEESRQLVQIQRMRDAIAQAEQRREQQAERERRQEIQHLTQVQRMRDSITQAEQRRQQQEEQSRRQETEHLIEVQRIRDSINSAEQERQRQADQEQQEEQERIQQGWQLIGGYLYNALVQNVKKATDANQQKNRTVSIHHAYSPVFFYRYLASSPTISGEARPITWHISVANFSA